METQTLLELVAARVDAELEDVVGEMVAAIVVTVPAFAADPVLRAEAAESCRGNVRRYTAVARRALDPPPAEAPPEALDFARMVVRRGIESDAVYQGYRRGQQVLWRRWMTAVEDLAPSREVLMTTLNVSLDLMFRYVDDVLGRVISEMQREREQVLGGALARRAETIRLLLDGAPLEDTVVASRLGLDLRLRHTAVVLWCDPRRTDAGVLETAALTLARATGAGRPLTLVAGASTLWAWLTTDRGSLDTAPLARGLPELDVGVRMAIGPTSPGAHGFRRSHEAAMTMYRLLRNDPGGAPIATYAELEITALAGQDRERASEFVAATLGPLAADASVATRLRETLRVYLDEAENAPRAAARLHTHRNTVLQRVARATELLGHAPGERRLAVELALELRRRLGPGGRPAGDV